MQISESHKTPSQYQLTRPSNNHNPLPTTGGNLPPSRRQRWNQPPSARRDLPSPGTTSRKRNNHTLPTTLSLVIINNHPHPGPVRPRAELDVGPLGQRDLGELQGAVEAGEAVAAAVLALGFALEVGVGLEEAGVRVGVGRFLGRGGNGDGRGDGDGDGGGDGWEEGFGDV